MKRMILWKSDLWSFALGFAFVGLFFLIGAVYQGLHGNAGESFGLGLVGAILIGAASAFACIDRGPAIERREAFLKEYGLPSARAIMRDSCLDPETEINRDRIRNPPTIG